MNRSDAENVLADAAPALLRFFLHRTHGDDDAADLVGDTLTIAWRSVRRMPADPEAARMWVFGVAKNTLRHHIRGGLRRDALVRKLGSALSEAASPINDDELDVRAAVAALPADLAELIRLVHWDGFTLEQAATLTGIPASTARGRHARAKELLRLSLPVPAQHEPTDGSRSHHS